MKKKYIILFLNIYGIGGAQQYLSNKTSFLKKKGFEVFVFSGNNNMNNLVLIDSLKGFEKGVFPPLMFSPIFSRRIQISKIIEEIKKSISFHPNDVCYIESNAIATAEWGEILAKEIKGKHILFNLQEQHNYSKEEIDFLRFKFNRKELSGIVKTSLQDMLKDKSIQFEDWMRISACCNNVVADCEDKFSDLLWKDADLTFGTIGRLDKECVLPVLEGILEYIIKNPGRKYNVVIIGGGRRITVKKIKNLLDSHSNINLIITDYIYPIPRSLLKNIDVFISTAGSATVSFNENRPTIKVHPVKGHSVGILGYTFVAGKSSMYDPPTISLPETIRQIINEKDKIVYRDNSADSYEGKMIAEFDRQLSFFELSNEDSDYYNTWNIRKNSGLRTMICMIVGKFCGTKKLQILLKIDYSLRNYKKFFKFLKCN